MGTCALDFLEIEDPNIFNHIIDQKQLEKVVVGSDEKMRSILSKENLVPQGTLRGLSFDFYKYTPKGQNRNYSSYYMAVFTGLTRKPDCLLASSSKAIEESLLNRNQ